MAAPAQYAQNSPVSGIDRAHRSVIFAAYVAEHAPPGRGFYTSWIQTTATFGLFLT
jgi:hypothetical protein